SIGFDADGNLEVDAVVARDNHFKLSHASGFTVIEDASGDADTALQINAISGAQLDPANGNRAMIPDSAFATTAQGTPSLIVNAGLGDDAVDLDTTGGESPIPPAGLTVDLGDGEDTLALVNNATDNVWTTDGTQDGNIVLGALGTSKFHGL